MRSTTCVNSGWNFTKALPAARAGFGDRKYLLLGVIEQVRWPCGRAD